MNKLNDIIARLFGLFMLRKPLTSSEQVNTNYIHDPKELARHSCFKCKKGFLAAGIIDNHLPQLLD